MVRFFIRFYVLHRRKANATLALFYRFKLIYKHFEWKSLGLTFFLFLFFRFIIWKICGNPILGLRANSKWHLFFCSFNLFKSNFAQSFARPCIGSDWCFELLAVCQENSLYFGLGRGLLCSRLAQLFLVFIIAQLFIWRFL